MALKGKINPTRSIQAKSVTHIPTQRLTDLADVDTTNRQDGSVILWDSASATWKVQGEIENPLVIIIGGSF
jgi:hypothetical protein